MFIDDINKIVWDMVWKAGSQTPGWYGKKNDFCEFSKSATKMSIDADDLKKIGKMYQSMVNKKHSKRSTVILLCSARIGENKFAEKRSRSNSFISFSFEVFHILSRV